MKSFTLEKETISRLGDQGMGDPELPGGYPISMPPWCQTHPGPFDRPAAHPAAPDRAGA